jgi:uncharacterized protein
LFSYLAPTIRLDSVLELTPAKLHSLGLQGLLLDVDCTLKDYHADDLSTDVLAWSQELGAAGIRQCLLSNGKSKRIEKFARCLKIPFVAKAFKPMPFGCYAGLKKLTLPKARVAVVGDQLFADILAGRLARLFTILVRPTSAAEPWFTRIKRPIERKVLRWMAGSQ